MATKTINTRIVLKTDTEALWTSNDPVLLKGEIGIASDLNKFKIGDGTKKWSELKYAGLSPEEVTKLIGDNRDSVYVYNVPTAAASDENITDATAITTALGSNAAKQGDMAIIIREIGKWADGKFTGTDKQAYTAYVYDGSAWKAMDGNYSADNVYLSSDITMAGNYTAVGNLTKSQNGTATFSTKGKSVSEALTEIFTKVLQPSKSNPTISITSTKAGSYEAGTKVIPAYTTSFNAGSYTYGPATGITVSEYTITNNTTEESLSTATGSFAELTVTATTNFVMTAVAKHTAGVAAKNNVGGTTTVKIDAGSTSAANSSAIKGYQQGYYIGTTTSKTATATSAIVRGLSTKKNANYAAGKVNFTVPKGAASVIIACPADKTGMTDVLNTTVNANMTTSFVKSTVKVAGADGDINSAYAKNYNVWIFSPAEAYGSTAALTITLG